MGRKIEAVKGKVYGRLTLIEETKPHYTSGGQKQSMVLAQCSCDKIKSYKFAKLRNGHTKSCGCLQRETISATGKLAVKHGLSAHPLYHRWRTMMNRVYNPENRDYWKYRKIKVCKRWHSIENYIEDVYPTFFEDAQLDRIDNYGDYSFDNTQWLDSMEHGLKSNREKRLNEL